MTKQDKIDKLVVYFIWFLLFLIVVFKWVLLFACPAQASAPLPEEINNLQCGVRPIPPVGCKMSSIMCVCDAYKTCQWVFTDC